jgi:predicted DNA-binding transcriptional regulator AlpA
MMPSPKLIDPREVKRKTTLSEREQQRRAKDGRFPKPVKIGEGKNGRIAYVENEIDDWTVARIAERDHQLQSPESAGPTPSGTNVGASA